MADTWPQFTADQWIEALERNLTDLRGPNSMTARNAANKLASSFVSDNPLEPIGLLQAAREQLPTIAPQRTAYGHVVGAQPAPNDRTPAFDEAMERFITLFRENVEKRRQFDAEVAANAHLDYDECVDIVLEFLIKQRDGVFVRPIIVGTKLSHNQVVDALQWISDHHLLSRDSHRGSDAWYVKTNSFAREELRRRRTSSQKHETSQSGSTPSRQPYPPAQLNINMHLGSGNTFNNSPIGISAAGSVSVTNTPRLPEMPSALRTAISSNAPASSAVSELEAELKKTTPNKGVAERLFGTARTAIGVLTAGTDIAAHGHEWLEGVQTLIDHLADLVP